jgi:hypothetical protein
MKNIRQAKAARKNIKRAQATWKGMSHRQHALAQPQGRSRRKPGTTGKGKYYRIQVRPKEEFVTFRTQDVGRAGHIERLAGKRRSGSWDTQAWLVSKKDAHVSGGRLIIDKADISKSIRGPIKHVKGDIFQAKPRRDIPEREKPTAAMRKAQTKNIKKAQAARHAMVR